MSNFQIIFTLVLLALAVPSWGRQRYAWACLMVNLVATLAVCLAMDEAVLSGAGATRMMMVIDAATMAALVVRPGVPSLIAVGYMVSIYVYVVSRIFDAQRADLYAMQNALAALQLMVLWLGGLGGISGGGGHRRYRLLRLLGGTSRRDQAPPLEGLGAVSAFAEIATHEQIGRANA